MRWDEIRQRYPDQWLLVEALDAHTEGDQRILNQLAVVDTFTDSTQALRRYQELHHESREREIYVFHTSREQLRVTEQKWLGIRL
jgi:hypothetical protein